MSRNMRITETARIIISMGEKIDHLEEENEQLKSALTGIYNYLSSVLPEGAADEAFRIVPDEIVDGLNLIKSIVKDQR